MPAPSAGGPRRDGAAREGPSAKRRSFAQADMMLETKVGSAAPRNLDQGSVAMKTGRSERASGTLSGPIGTTLIFLLLSIALHIDNIIFGKFSFIPGKDWLG